jgi:hypothetical protein
MNIKFTDTFQSVPEIYAPKPASAVIPDWYKKIESFQDGKKQPDGNGNTTATIKKCMPVFDAITAGYILFTPADVWVSQKFDETFQKIIPFYEWANFGLLQFHPVVQAPNHPSRNGHENYPKWINPWSIQTPVGYSTLFTQPFHRESIFTILDGVVDTDIYTPSINFPFVLNDINFEGLIPAGTPMAQVIPIKRDSWEMVIGNDEDVIQQNKLSIQLKSKFFDSYKFQFRQKKEYK